MRRIPALGLMVSVCALAVGPAPGRAEDKKVNLEGTWIIVGMEVGGKALPEDLVAKSPEAERTIKITADKMIATKNGKEDPATYKLDTSKTPHEIDLVGKDSKGKEEKLSGIFKVDGDKLTLCVAQGDRPKEFKTTEKGQSMIMILQKKKN
jgi:uncharacterized protein (TIGR03067 family)